MIKYFFISILAVISVVSILSCKKDKVPAVLPIVASECPDTISFSTQIEPVIVANCSVSGCHDNFSQASQLSLDGHGNISANASDILTVIRHEGGLPPMPQGGNKLADSLIQQFKCWKDQGALNN